LFEKAVPKLLVAIHLSSLPPHPSYLLNNSTARPSGRKLSVVFQTQLGEIDRSLGKHPPNTCQLLASGSAGRMQRQLALVFLGFSP
jgi:hypothetical protein